MRKVNQQRVKDVAKNPEKKIEKPQTAKAKSVKPIAKSSTQEAKK
jgi:hypothetical protein